MAVYVKRKLISSRVEDFQITGKTQLTEIVARSDLPEVIHDYVNVTIDGILIPKEEWKNTFAYAKNVVYIALVPRGGEGKSPLASIATLALVAFAPWAGAQLTGAAIGSTAASIASVGIMFVGTLVISALFPPTLRSDDSGDDAEGFYGIEGIRNKTRAYEAVRSVYGVMRIGPDMAVEPLIRTSWNTQTLFVVYDFGYGHLDITDIRIGNTAISDYSDVFWQVQTNYTNEALPYYQNDNITEVMNVEMLQNQPVIRTSATDDCNEMTITLSFPTGLFRVDAHGDDAGDKESQDAYFKIEYKSTSDTIWNYYSVLDYTFSRTLTKVGSVARNLTFDYDDIYTVTQVDGVTAIPAYCALDSDYDNVGPFAARYTPCRRLYTVSPVSTLTATDKPTDLIVGETFSLFSITFTITVIAGNEITFTPALPSGYRYWDEINTVYYCTAGAESECFYYEKWVAPSPVTNVAALAPSPHTSVGLSITKLEPFFVSIGFVLPHADEWEVRITRTDTVAYLDNAVRDTQSYDKVELASIVSSRSVVPLKFDTPHTVMSMRIQATSQLSGLVDSLSARCSRLLWTWHPTNSFVATYNSNPAWVALDLFIGGANADPIAATRIDLQAFYEWSLFCDTQVDDGYGGTHSKHTCNVNMTSNSTVYKRLEEVLATGRATLTMRENKYSVIWEKFPATPVYVQLLTNKNSWDFKGSKVFTKEPHGLKCTYIEPDNSWQATDVVVYNDGYAEVADDPGDANCFDSDGDPVDCVAATYFENLSMLNTTNYRQVYRDGRYYLAQGKLRPETFTVTTDIENLVCERGDLISVQHDVSKAGAGLLSSRIEAISGNTITLREPLIYDAAKTYTLRVRLGSGSNIGTQEEYDVLQQAPVDAYTLTLTTEPTQYGVTVGDLCVYGESTEEIIDDFLVKTISPAADLTASITLIPYSPEIDDADTGVIPDYDPPIQLVDMLYPQCAIDLNYTSTLYYVNRVPLTDVKLTWGSVGTNVQYEIWQTTTGDGDYQYVGLVTDASDEYYLYKAKNTLDDDYPDNDTIEIKVIPVNAYGYKVPLESCDSLEITPLADTTSPAKPLFFAGNVVDKTINFTWLPPEELDLAGYLLKYTPNTTSPDWDNATAEGGMISFNVTTATVNARVGAYMLKVLDTSGNISADYSLVKTTIPEVSALNLVDTVTEEPTFSGVKSEVEVVSSGLRLVSTGGAGTYVSYGTYNLSQVFAYDEVYNCYITAQIEGYTYEETPGPVTSEWNATVQIAAALTNETISEWTTLSSVDPISQTTDWGGWQTLTAGFFTGKAFKMRVVLTTSDPTKTPHVSNLTITVDVPERTEIGTDVQLSTLPAGTNGKRVTFSSAFKDKPVLNITEDNAVDGQYAVITLLDNEGFDIQFFTAVDAVGYSDTELTSVQFDFMAKGYGEQMTTVYNAVESGEDDDIAGLPIAAVNYLLL